MVWIVSGVAELSHNIPLSQNLIQNKVLTFFNFVKAKRGEEAAKEKFEVKGAECIRLTRRSPLHYVKVQGEQVLM